MKSILQFFTLSLLAFCLAISSCKKDSDTEQTAMTEEEAVETTEAIVASSTEDLTAVAETSEQYSTATDNTPASYCGETYDTTWTLTNSTINAGGTYTSNWSLKVNCTVLQVPTSLDLGVNANGNYHSLLTTGTEAGEGTYALSGLLSSADNYVSNGGYSSTGSVTSKVGLKNTYTLVADLQFNDLEIDKSTLVIASGTGSITLVATSSNGQNPVTFTGAITFNGGGNATLVIQGKSYTIQV